MFDAERIEVCWREKIPKINVGKLTLEESFTVFIWELNHEFMHHILQNYINIDVSEKYDDVPKKTILELDGKLPKVVYSAMEKFCNKRGIWE